MQPRSRSAICWPLCEPYKLDAWTCLGFASLRGLGLGMGLHRQLCGASKFSGPQGFTKQVIWGQTGWDDWEWGRFSLRFLPTWDHQLPLNFG